MELLLLLITSGIPGFYTYYSLSNKNTIYYNSDNKNIILSFFSIISILIFILILSLFSNINNVNELFTHLTFTKILLALTASVFIIVILTEIIYPLLFDLYNSFLNLDRNRHNLSKASTMPIHLSRYEDENHQIFVEIKTFDGSNIDDGVIKSYSRKSNRNLILQPIEEKYKIPLKTECLKTEKFIDFENQIIIYYYFL